MAGFFLYLISIFIYFARAMCAIMDIHVHGISPYDWVIRNFRAGYLCVAPDNGLSQGGATWRWSD